jgi:hypothetical protein
MNADDPVGTTQSIEHTLRALDKAAEDVRHQIQRLERTLTQAQVPLSASIFFPIMLRFPAP